MKLIKAMNQCDVHGYIYRKSNPEQKFWNQPLYFEMIRKRKDFLGQYANDWESHDPEQDERETFDK